jgi:Amino acid synthesis
VGTGGDLEHGAAMIHPRLGMAMRRAIKRGRVIIPGHAKVGPRIHDRPALWATRRGVGPRRGRLHARSHPRRTAAGRDRAVDRLRQWPARQRPEQGTRSKRGRRADCVLHQRLAKSAGLRHHCDVGPWEPQGSFTTKGDAMGLHPLVMSRVERTLLDVIDIETTGT